MKGNVVDDISWVGVKLGKERQGGRWVWSSVEMVDSGNVTRNLECLDSH